MSILDIWEATFTRHWHQHPFLSETGDPIAAHQGRTALLALVIYPREHAVLRAAIIHDMGEALIGDVPAWVKDQNPDLKAILDRIEAAAMADMGLPAVDLDEREADMLKLCDKLDAILWARHHKPDLMDDPKWQADIALVRSLSWRTGVGHVMTGLFGWAP